MYMNLENWFFGFFVHATIGLFMLAGVMCETIKPSNHAALKGQQIQLNCSTEDQYNGFWKYMKPLRGDIEMWIYKGHKVSDEFVQIYRINDSVQRHFNLIFNSSEATAGTYVCEPDISVAYSSEVIVIHESPTCQQSINTNSVYFFCDVYFSGNWNPDIEWHDSQGNKVEGNITSETIPNQRVSSSLTISVNNSVTQTPYNISCKLVFSLEKIPNGTSAKNVPELPLGCTNVVDLQAKETTSLTMITPGIPDDNTKVVIVVVVTVLVLLLIVGVASVLTLQKKKSRKGGKFTEKGLIESLSIKGESGKVL